MRQNSFLSLVLLANLLIFSPIFAQNPVKSIGFGSCALENRPQRILDAVNAEKPDVFIYLGDNIYGDTEDMNELKAQYDMLGANPRFMKLREQSTVLATWDDHDYGMNDAGKGYRHREESREIFLDFWKVRADAPRRQHGGIYDVQYFGEIGQRVQVILLDTRFFRDDLRPSSGKRSLHKYMPHTDTATTLLGEEQWEWLEEVLKEPAEFRILCSSIQFAAEYTGWEGWNNFPHEQERFYRLLQSTKAEGLVILSGDVHYADMSLRKIPGLYPIYDFTSSGLTHIIPKPWRNEFRIDKGFAKRNFGMLRFEWEGKEPVLVVEIRSIKGRVLQSFRVSRSELEF